jgi:hypothetical protein
VCQYNNQDETFHEEEFSEKFLKAYDKTVDIIDDIGKFELQYGLHGESRENYRYAAMNPLLAHVIVAHIRLIE